MPQGIVREAAPSTVYTEAPLWMQTVLNNTATYADFLTDLVRSTQRVDAQIADFLSQGDNDKAKIMLGKREMLIELRHIVEAYRKEEVLNNAR